MTTVQWALAPANQTRRVAVIMAHDGRQALVVARAGHPIWRAVLATLRSARR